MTFFLRMETFTYFQRNIYKTKIYKIYPLVRSKTFMGCLQKSL